MYYTSPLCSSEVWLTRAVCVAFPLQSCGEGACQAGLPPDDVHLQAWGACGGEAVLGHKDYSSYFLSRSSADLLGGPFHLGQQWCFRVRLLLLSLLPTSLTWLTRLHWSPTDVSLQLSNKTCPWIMVTVLTTLRRGGCDRRMHS